MWPALLKFLFVVFPAAAIVVPVLYIAISLVGEGRAPEATTIHFVAGLAACSASLPRKSKHGHTWPPPRARVDTVVQNRGFFAVGARCRRRDKDLAQVIYQETSSYCRSNTEDLHGYNSPSVSRMIQSPELANIVPSKVLISHSA
jgi:hypothetical protein